MQSLLQTCTAPLQVAEAQGEAGDAEVVQVSLADVEVATVDAFQVCKRCLAAKMLLASFCQLIQC